MFKKITLSSLFIYSQISIGLPSGSPICNVFADYSNITAMTDRDRNFNSGEYSLTSNVSEYNVFEHVELTISGPTFIGLMFTVVDSNGQNVGQFSPDSQVDGCNGNAMSITHNQDFGSNSKTLFWIPPDNLVGDVFVEGYVLSGMLNDRDSQSFYRFVRDDQSALELTESDVLFSNGFE